MPKYTDSVIVEYNEDGSRTETSVVTYQPITKTQQTLAWAGLTVLVAAPFVPLLAVSAYEKFEEKLASRKAKKHLKSVK